METSSFKKLSAISAVTSLFSKISNSNGRILFAEVTSLFLNETIV